MGLTLRGYPPFRSDPREDDIRRYFKYHNHEQQYGLSVVELVLVDTDVFKEGTGDGVA